MSVSTLLRDRLKDMRPSEAEAARRLLRNLGRVAELSLRDIAAYCRTSDATVMRACRTAGFDGYQDLKYHVLREFTAGGAGEAPKPPAAYQEDIRASLVSAAAHLDRAAAILRAATRVALVGVGASYGIALVATDILFTLHKQALPIHDDQMAGFAFTPPVSGLVLLAISHSGETQFVLRVVQTAHRAGLKTIGLTNEPGSELAAAVDVVVPTQAVEQPHGSFAIAPRLCQLAVLDALFSRACLPATKHAKPGKRS